MNTPNENNRRILVIDDNSAIHSDFRKILCDESHTTLELEQTEAALFGKQVTQSTQLPIFTVDSASQGDEGVTLVREAIDCNHPYAVAFVDMRMPPGWDGIETVCRIWEIDKEIQIVICTAYSDYSWEDMSQSLTRSDGWLILKKPFDNIEVSQIATALTDKWNLARKAHKKMDILESAVRSRTKELDAKNMFLEDTLARLQEVHAQLLHADKMASIGQLAAGVAHAINSPVGSILSNLTTLHKSVGDIKKVLSAHEDFLKTAMNTPKLAEMANRLLATRNDLEIEYTLADLEDIVAETVEETEQVRKILADLQDVSHVDNLEVTDESVNTLMDKAINIAWDELRFKANVIREYANVPTIPCYAGKIRQIFLNVLINAAHAIDETGTITIRTHAATSQVIVEIADTGCGIPHANLRRIFEPFFTTKEVGKNTGMGLHLAQKIIEAHAGQISVKSELSKGTTFRITLPIIGPPTVKKTYNEFMETTP